MPGESKRPSCVTCPYWDEEQGLCRRNAPQWLGHVEGNDWSVTNPTDFCGDHPDFPAWLASVHFASKETK